jgi:hypothetical protein
MGYNINFQFYDKREKYRIHRWTESPFWSEFRELEYRSEEIQDFLKDKFQIEEAYYFL